MIDSAPDLVFILLDDDWRPVLRLARGLPWRAVVEQALRQDSRWVAMEQVRTGNLPVQPTANDIALTRAACRRLRPIDISLVDHVIHGATERYSFRANGLL
jgi:DNA repair protein RadC